jgi:hypothetical protein
MGHTAVMIAAVSVATAIICLCAGYFLGRTNVRLRVEDALKKERISADAREYTLRQQLEDKMAETSDLRSRVEELKRSQDPREQQKRKQINEAAERARQTTQTSEQLHTPAEEEPPVIESADERIQNLLKSIQDKLKQPVDEPAIHAPQAAEIPPAQVNSTPEPVKTPEPVNRPAVNPPAVSAPAVASRVHPVPVVPAKVALAPAVPASPVSPAAKSAPVVASRIAATPAVPAPAVPKPAAPTPAVKDEWQEFAASLATLTRDKK